MVISLKMTLELLPNFVNKQSRHHSIDLCKNLNFNEFEYYSVYVRDYHIYIIYIYIYIYIYTYLKGSIFSSN